MPHGAEAPRCCCHRSPCERRFTSILNQLGLYNKNAKILFLVRGAGWYHLRLLLSIIWPVVLSAMPGPGCMPGTRVADRAGLRCPCCTTGSRQCRQDNADAHAQGRAAGTTRADAVSHGRGAVACAVFSARLVDALRCPAADGGQTRALLGPIAGAANGGHQLQGF